MVVGWRSRHWTQVSVTHCSHHEVANSRRRSGDAYLCSATADRLQPHAQGMNDHHLEGWNWSHIPVSCTVYRIVVSEGAPL